MSGTKLNPAAIFLFLWIPLSTGISLQSDGLPGGFDPALLLTAVFYMFGGIMLLMRSGSARFNAPLLVMVAYILLSGALMGAGSADFWLKGVSILGVLLVATMLTSRLSLGAFVRITAWSLTFTFLLSVAYAVLFPEASTGVVMGEPTLQSFYDQKNVYGRMLYCCIFFCVASLLLNRSHLLEKLLLPLIILGCLVVLKLTGSKTALALGLLALVLMLGLRLPLLPTVVVPLTLLVLVSGLLLLASFDQVSLVETGSPHDYLQIYNVRIPMTGRATIWDALGQALTENHAWLFGFGLGAFFPEMAEVWLEGIGLGQFIPDDSHNGFVDAVVNTGVIGLLGFVGLLVAWLVKTARQGDERAVRAIQYSFFLLFLLANVTESYLVKSSNIMTFTFYCLFIYSGRAR